MIDVKKLPKVELTVEMVRDYEMGKSQIIRDFLMKEKITHPDGTPITEKDIILSGNPLSLISDTEVLKKLIAIIGDYEIEAICKLYGVKYSPKMTLKEIKMLKDKLKKDNGVPENVGGTIGEIAMYFQ